MEKFIKMRSQYIARQGHLLYMCLVVFLLAFGNLNAQITPIAIDNNPTNDCSGNNCWDWFNWSPIQDGMGNAIGGEGIAEDNACGTTIGATVEYTGADATPDFTGTLVGANTTDGTTPDIWTFSFDVALTNPVFDVNSLENDTELCFTDCLGNPLTITILGTSLDPGPSGAHCVTSGTNFIQVTGTYDCITITGTIPDNDPYTIGVGTCLAENPPPPVPPCTTCTAGTDYELISLDQTGTNPTTGFSTGIVEINNVCIGSYEFLFSDLDVNEDGNGTQFGGWDIDGGTMLLQIDFCDPLIVQQLDIRNLEVESEVSVGTTISGTGAAAVLGGQTLTVCSDLSGRMGVEPNPGNGEMNFVKTDGPGCSANPNGSYTFGTNPVSTLYFKYQNPAGGCTGDYVGFRIGTCYTPPPMVAPVCPVEIVQITCDMADVIANGPNNANTDEVAVDGNGNYFNFSSCSASLENAVTNGTMLQTVDIGCAELVQTTEECVIANCVIIPPCATCPVGSEYKFINLAGGSDEDGDGLEEGEIYLDGVCIGSFDVIFSDLDVTEDVSGTQFGGWDNDGGVYALQLDFCDPLLIEELYIRNLEVESQVSVGTTISGTPGPGAPATLGGLDLTFCDGSLRMLPEDPPVNQVITDGPGCGANPNAVYTIGGTAVSTLYFQYHNPPGGCTGDYVGFKIGTCVTPPPMVVPVCPFEEVRVTCDMQDVIANGINNGNTDLYVIDGAGNYFDFTNCNATALNDAYTNGTMLQTVDIGCAELVETIEECVPAGCVIEPTCAATMCPPDNNFGYISLNQNGTNGAGFPMGAVELDNVKIGTYEFLFSDLDVSEDGNGTTFGGWDNDGGTMLLQMDFCDQLMIQELDIRNLEVESQVSIGTTISGTGAAAVLGGQTLTVCDDPSGRMGVGPAPNEVITDGPGCGANTNATYTVGTNPVTTLYFKYHNPPGGCRGDYVGFRIGVCDPELPMAIPLCPLTLFEVDDCPNDPNNPISEFVQDANGNWFDFGGNCPTAIPTGPVQTIRISPCATTTFEALCPGCCEFTAACPNNTDLGDFDCTQLGNIPAPPTTAAEAAAPPYNITIGATPCGTVQVLSMDDIPMSSYDVCVMGGQTVTRTVTVFDDLDGNGMLDAGEESQVCTYTFDILEDTTPPTIACPADVTIECGDSTDPGTGSGSTGTVSGSNTTQLSWADGTTGLIGSPTTTTSGAPVGATITDVDISIEMDHSWTGDLTFELFSPDGTPVTILSGVCDGSSNNDNINATFDDAGVPIVCGTTTNNPTAETCNGNFAIQAAISGTVLPSSPLSAFNGGNPNGNWTLNVSDGVGGDAGCLNSFTVTVDWELLPTGGTGTGTATAMDICDPNPSVDFTDSFAPAACSQAGVITRTWFATDACGNVSATCEQTITINPPLLPTVTAPTFPASVTCVEAEAFVAPNATYTNGLVGTCELTGEIVATIDNNWDACGGSLTVNYNGFDDCGRSLSAGPFTIMVDPAPVPVISYPAYSSPLTCETALTFSIADATYTNGLTGACNISGTIPAVFDNNFDACGGNITVYYSTFDQCGNFITIAPLILEVQPAPIPTITPPTLPASLSCDAAGTYTPPPASFDNGQPGACNLSGTASAIVNHFYDACGGEIQVIYLGEDDCGRSLVKNITFIPVDPAPAPTIDVPSFPTSLSCSDAESYQAPITSYDNGLDGDCNISGLIVPVATYNGDACNGGTLTILYSDTDDCGNVLTASVGIQVEPAPAATLKGPNIPSTIECWQASSGYAPGNATYSNGETGFCENAGEIEPVISELWNSCDGGIIIYDYSGVDDCGNVLTPIVIKVSVLPDTWAPNGGCAPFEETMLSIDDVPEPDGLDYYLDQVAAGYDEPCGEVIVTVIGDTGTPQCSGDGFFERVYTVEIADECGNVTGTCSITFSGNCNASYCTLSQKFYGYAESEMNGQSSEDIINTLLDNGANPIVIGDGTDCGFIIDEAQCVQDMLSSYGAAISLPAGYALDCANTHNSLINQIVVTILNIRYNESLNPAGSLDFGDFALSAACMNVPGWILAELPDNPTVNDLLEYANNYLACQCNDTCGIYQGSNPTIGCLTNLFWGLNSRFDNCQVPGPCGSNFTDPNLNGQPPVITNNTLEVFPNPTDDFINLKVTDFMGLPAVIEIFDTRGAKLGERTYLPIEQNILEFNVQNFEAGLYWISITVEGHDLITKKFVVRK